MLSGASGEALTACGAVVRVRAGVLGTERPGMVSGGLRYILGVFPVLH